MVVGGSVTSISFDGRQFSAPADADYNKKLGGFENELQANGDGTTRKIKTRVPGMISGIVVTIDTTQSNQEFLQSLADSNILSQVVLEEASSEVYTGQGTIVGEIVKSTNSATATFDFAVSGKLIKQ